MVPSVFQFRFLHNKGECHSPGRCSVCSLNETMSPKHRIKHNQFKAEEAFQVMFEAFSVREVHDIYVLLKHIAS